MSVAAAVGVLEWIGKHPDLYVETRNAAESPNSLPEIVALNMKNFHAVAIASNYFSVAGSLSKRGLIDIDLFLENLAGSVVSVHENVVPLAAVEPVFERAIDGYDGLLEAAKEAVEAD